MRPELTHRTILILLLVSIILPGCISMPRYKAKGEQAINAAHQPASAIDVQTFNGAVTIAAGGRDEVVVKANITAAGDTQDQADQRLSLVKVSADRLSDGTLKIFATFPDQRRSNDGCAFDITVPDTAGVTVKSSNGGITLIALGGDVNLTTSNGPIRVERQAGAVTADTSNGPVDVISAGGDVNVHTSNGTVDVNGFAGSATLDTSNGRVTCRADSASTGPINITTSNGSITLDVPESLGGSVDASTSNASITVSGGGNVQGSKSHRTVSLSGAGPVSTIRTSNGGITIHVQAPPSGDTGN